MAELGTERVTAGLPRLSPSVRFELERKDAKRQKQIAIDSEVARKRDEAISPDGDRDRTDLRASIGTPLHASAIIHRLSSLNPSLDFRHHPFLKRFLIFLPDPAAEKKERYLCAFEDNYSPEFEIMHFHEEEHVEGYGADAKLVTVKILDGTTRGWVPLLRKLISLKAITKSGAERLFRSVYSKAWQEGTAGY